MKTIERQCKLLVIGAGASGICAAISASRQGVDTVLIEKDSFAGGALIKGLHRYICGLYLNGSHKPRSTLNGGMAREIESRLKKKAHVNTITRMGKVYVLPFFKKDLISVFSTMLGDAENLKVLYNTCPISTSVKGGHIEAVTTRWLGSKNNMVIKPRAIIDCSGEGALIVLSGAKYRISKPKIRQLSGYSIRIKGLRKVEELLTVKASYYMRHAVEIGKLPLNLKFTSFFKGDNPDEMICKFNILPGSEIGVNRNNAARMEAKAAHRFLSRTIHSFRRSYIAEVSQEVLDREGIRISGEYTLSANDVLNGRKFRDGTVKNAWPIELWYQKKGPQYMYLRTGDYYEIPSRVFRSRDISNLFCSGRCISVSNKALGSTRVAGTCFSLGEQAGSEAARYATEK